MTLSEDQNRRGVFPNAMALFRDSRTRREARLIAPYLDRKFYLENNADVAAAGIDASYHYAKFGWREGRDPSPSFSTTGYLSAHPDLAIDGTNPFLHFIRQGSKDAEPASRTSEDKSRLDTEVQLVSKAIDETHYARTCPGFQASGKSAAMHYCQIGWREGQDPTPAFSTRYYLTTNPDVRESGLNPFWHYLTAGRDEGRLPSHPGGWRHDVLSRQTSFEAYCDAWIKGDTPPELLETDTLREALEQGRRFSGLLLSLGHDDYRATPGGVQLCVEIEERDAAAHGLDYLNVHPWQPLPKLAERDEDYSLSLVLNGDFLGTARVSVVNEVLSQLPDAGIQSKMVIHHLAGHAPERIVELATGVAPEQVHFWLHDYFTLCTSYALQRNNVTPCSVPDAASNACHICLFGSARRQQETRIAALFERLDIQLISPSDVALAFWEARTKFKPARTRVHPHVVLSPTTVPVRADAPRNEGEVRIAFIGTPAVHKGWPVFLELQRRLASNDAYSFWFFGASDPGIAGITHVATHVRASDPASTFRAVADNSIDIVLHWASWPETFSFSTFEALGGGAFVITNEGSGNVAAAVEHFERGVVLADCDALYDFVQLGRLEQLANEARYARRERGLVACFSGMTLDTPQLEEAS